MKEIRISVALASYNGEKYIKEQLDSILRNLSSQDEIIVSDDGSADGTLSILNEYKNGEIPFRIVQGPGKGIKQNICEALKYCRGKYIFLADQDDVWTDDKVENVLRYLGKDGCNLVCHDAKVMDASLSKMIKPSFFSYRGSKAGVWNNFIKNRYMGCCMAFGKSLLPFIIPIPDEIEMHDQWIGIINDIKGGHSKFITDKLLFYRRHSENVSDFSHGTIPQMIAKRYRLLRALVRRLVFYR